VANWTFLTNHAQVLLCIAHEPGTSLRDIAASLNITERSAFSIVTELTDAGYVVRQKDGDGSQFMWCPAGDRAGGSAGSCHPGMGAAGAVCRAWRAAVRHDRPPGRTGPRRRR
jgi:MarR family